MVVAGCTSSGSGPTPGPSPSPTTIAVSVRSCPHHVTAHVRNVAAPTDMLVSPDPAIGRLCRYYPVLGLSGKGVPHGTLYGQAELGPTTARRLFGTHDFLMFGYEDRRTLTVLATPDVHPPS